MAPSKPDVWDEESNTGVAARATAASATNPPNSGFPEPEDTARITVPRVAISLVDPGEARNDTPLLPSAPTLSGNARAVLIVMTGLEAGRVIRLDGPGLTFGRDASCDVPVEDHGVSRQHARIMRSPEGGFCVEDLRSRNGTFVGMQKVTLAELSSGDHVQLGPTYVVRFAIADDTEESLQRQLYESSIRDALTGAFNRKYLAERLSAEVAHAHRTGSSFAVLMIDIDHFKDFNDAHGHLAGDKALRLVATAMTRVLRTEDVLARYGGEEFVVLARATDEREAAALAERLRFAVESLHFAREEGAGPITVSVGVARLAEIDAALGVAALVGLADQRLYGAKLRGRNQVCTDD